MKKTKSMDRRGFIKTSGLGIAGVGTLLSVSPLSAGQDAQAEIPKIKGYRTLGRTGFKVSDIGIGTARVYPVPVMNAVLDAGVNYIDSSERYGRGTAEKNIGEAIKGRDRKSLFITTKISTRGVSSKEEVVEKVQECLQRLQTDYIDCLLTHGPQTIEELKSENFHRAMDQLKKEGKIRFIGVSHHGSHFQNQDDSMEKILLAAVEDGRFDLLLLVYNFIQREVGEKIMNAAVKKNIATTIMKSNPLGRYFEMKERIEKMKKSGEEINDRTMSYMTRMEDTAKQAETFLKKNNLKDPAEIKAAALKFVLGNAKVNTLNLAFNNFDDVRNLLRLSGSGMEPAEQNLLAGVEEECGRLYCRHACGICEFSCPDQVPVNTIMRYQHYFEASGGEKFAMEKYANLDSSKADLCRNCQGLCENACPYGVPIQGLLTMAHAQLSLSSD